MSEESQQPETCCN